MKRYRVTRPVSCDSGTFKVGDEITVMGERVWYNGGMLDPASKKLILDLLEYEKENGFKHLREVAIPYNKA